VLITPGLSTEINFMYTPGMEWAEVGRRIYEVAVERGPVILRSGVTSDIYVNKYKIAAEPELLKFAAILLAQLIPLDVQVVAGVELGGVPFATMVSSVTRLPLAIIRKEAKAHGKSRIIEGASVNGRIVVVLEDVAMSGGSSKESVAKVRAEGGYVNQVISLVNRGEETPVNNLEPLGVGLASLYRLEDLLMLGE
jgi:orotate phosphoribosyltransferase